MVVCQLRQINYGKTSLVWSLRRHFFYHLITALRDHSPSPMPSLQGSCLGSLMSHFIYERVGFHCLWFLLGLHPECSLSSVLSCCNPLYLLCVQLRAFTLTAMALVVRVKPNDTKLLDGILELLTKVEAVEWLPFFRKFTDLNLEVTRLFVLLLVDARVKMAYL